MGIEFQLVTFAAWLARRDFWREKCLSVQCRILFCVEYCATFQAALYMRHTRCIRASFTLLALLCLELQMIESHSLLFIKVVYRHLKVMRYHTHSRASRIGYLKEKLVASRMLVWLNKALHIQSEQRLHFVFCKNSG